MKWVRRSTLIKCSVHQTVLKTAKTQIENKGWFGKEQILRSAGHSAMADSIRWDYIVEWINKDLDTELIPIVSLFGKKIKKDDEDIVRFPHRYIASGHGKRTWGYANAEELNGVLAVRRLAQRKAQAKGAKESVDKSEKN